MGTNAIFRDREHRKSRFRLWGTGKQINLFQGNKGTVPHWDGLIVEIIKYTVKPVLRVHPREP